MVDPLGPRYIGPSHGINRVVPSKDRESKKKNPGEEARPRDEDGDEEFVRKGRRIDDRA